MLINLLIGCTSMTLPPSSEDFVLHSFPEDNIGSKYFNRFSTAFGVYVLVAESVSDQDALHATNVLAQYLDNDEDGEPDESSIVETMVNANSAMMIFETESELRRSGVFRGGNLSNLSVQDLYGEEILPHDGFDATLEEVLHLITQIGYAEAFPDDYAEEGSSSLTEAMDIARGGHFTTIPDNYPEEGWYHYEDQTCEYNCMATEYLYWSLTSLLGGQSNRCSEIEDEWELCTPEQVESVDTSIVELLRNGVASTPQVLPDGNYRNE